MFSERHLAHDQQQKVERVCGLGFHFWGKIEQLLGLSPVSTSLTQSRADTKLVITAPRFSSTPWQMLTDASPQGAAGQHPAY